jgi:riboflavin kinase/FMN adenylyltransferase
MNKTKKLQAKSYKLTGRVIRGDGYGRKLGFPTANIDRKQYVREGLRVKLGVWAGIVEIQNEEFRMKNKKAKILHSAFKNLHFYKAAIVIGPIDRTGLPKLEVYLIGFKGNLYGKKIKIILYKFLRKFRKFKSETDLKMQIKSDVNHIKRTKILYE